MRIRQNDADTTGSTKHCTKPSDFIPGAELTQTEARRGTVAAEISASYARQSGHIFQTVLKPVGTGSKPMVVGYSLSHFPNSNSPKTSWNRFKIDGCRRLF
jgi:hypothetical protein